MINVAETIDNSQKIEAIALSTLEARLEDYQNSDGSIAYCEVEKMFTLGYSSTLHCECCSYDFGQEEISIEELQEILNAI